MNPGGLVLAIDCGNSRLKWGVCAPDQESARGAVVWIAQGAMEVSGIARLSEVWTFQAEPETIVISNVAGPEVAESITRGFAHWSAVPHWIRSPAAQCGVFNGYADPSRLGVDRWAALVGARALNPGDCLVVMAGTATTVDVLTREGLFRGGLILPGEQLMKRSLATGTAGLPMAQGVLTDFPRNTEDAIEAGCMAAQTGAIERMYARLPANALCILSGGGAARLAGQLNIPVHVVDNLVLEGLARIAVALRHAR